MILLLIIKQIIMKRTLKITVYTSILLTFGLLFGVMNSCTTEENYPISSKENFLQSLKENVPIFSQKKLALNKRTRGIGIETTNSTYEHGIIIDFLEDSPKPENVDLEKIETFGDLMTLIRDTDATIQLTDSIDGNSDNTIVISEEQAKNALKDIVIKCKQYLYLRGMTEYDIQEMLKEENVDETQLVPLVLAMEYQEREGNIASTLTPGNKKNIPFIITCKAINSNDLLHFGTCLLKASGIDIFTCIASSGLKTWSAAQIKKSFKTIVKKAFGPIGVAIFMIEFSNCVFY